MDTTPLLTTRAAPPILDQAIRMIETTWPRLTGRMTDDAVLRDHGIDSLDRMELVLVAEGAFGIDLSDDAIEGIATVADLAAAILTALVVAQAALPTADYTARPRGPVDDPLTQRDAEADGAVQGAPGSEDAA